MAEHSLVVKRDGKDVIYSVDAKSPADAKQVAERAEARLKERLAR